MKSGKESNVLKKVELAELGSGNVTKLIRKDERINPRDMLKFKWD